MTAIPSVVVALDTVDSGRALLRALEAQTIVLGYALGPRGAMAGHVPLELHRERYC
jgi:hypothetical protein